MDTATLIIIVLLGALLTLVAWSLFFRAPKKAEPDQSVVILSNRLESLQTQMSQQLEQNRQASERASGSMTTQVGAFTRGMEQLRAEVSRVQEQVHQVVSFQDIFRNPKLRGGWGEYSLESALGQYFPAGSWHMQHAFRTDEGEDPVIVDAVIQLPNGYLLPVDAKFNWDNFQAMVKADNDIAKEGYRKQFLSDVKKKVDEIATKYLRPEENTTDFALMYIPAEAVYYEVINNLGEADVADYARRKKVILCSPNTFYLTVTAVQHWFRDAQFSKSTQAIMAGMTKVIKDSEKLADDFRLVGKHLSNTRSAYEDADKRLGLLVNKTQKVLQLGDEQTALKEE